MSDRPGFIRQQSAFHFQSVGGRKAAQTVHADDPMTRHDERNSVLCHDTSHRSGRSGKTGSLRQLLIRHGRAGRDAATLADHTLLKLGHTVEIQPQIKQGIRITSGKMGKPLDNFVAF